MFYFDICWKLGIDDVGKVDCVDVVEVIDSGVVVNDLILVVCWWVCFVEWIRVCFVLSSFWCVFIYLR